MASEKPQLKTYRYGTPREDGEGLRIGVTRYPPRGIKKEEYVNRDQFDVRVQALSPSRDLIKWFLHETHQEPRDVEKFFRAYRKEMADSEHRQIIELLAKMAQRTPIAIGCGCEDENKCHRKALVELIRDAA